MKLYAPTYYKKFRCIADACEHSCCIGWEIDIDEYTLEKYKMLDCPYGSAICDSISMKETPHFQLGEGDRCPHLDECGLCKIILSMGEDYLCDICREHPRFYNYTSVAEVGVGASCPEAARLILSSPDFAVFEEIGEVATRTDDVPFDGCAVRGELYAILEDAANTYFNALEKVYSAYSIEVGDDNRWLKILSSLEYLNADHKQLFMKYSSKLRPEDGKTDDYLKRFLAYLVYRHCTEAINENDFAVRLSFCLFCERLLASLICSQAAGSLQEVAALASIISEEIEYSEENTWALMG
ncbi:MAG: hypothetical protein E7584_01325 [Ruminococcaceae bacterium]|nr:hypothetical protein [Oscillospiraceae bacterium]